MACKSCSSGSCGSTSASGEVKGCQSNGGCGTGGCNKMNVFDWLSDLDVPSFQRYHIVEVKFKGGRKEYFRNVDQLELHTGDAVMVDSSSGTQLGTVSLQGELVRLQLLKKNIKDDDKVKNIFRLATEKDIEKHEQAMARDLPTMYRGRQIISDLKLNMKLSDVEFQSDGAKAIFYYSSEDRVDFRELIKLLATEFKIRVEMKQISLRQEAGRLGGIGVCGRELCCSTWLSDFKNVTTSAARYQNLSLNPVKLSGQCGRLKCCLNFELDTYLDALQAFPDYADNLQTAMGTAFLIKKDIFKNLMWYTLPNNTKHYPLTIERVKEIKRLNQQGVAVEELEAVEITSKNKEVEPEFVELVGQISLRSLEKNDRRRRDQQRNYREPQGPNQNGPRPNNGPRPQGPNRPQGSNPNGPRPNQNGPRPNNGPRPQGPNGPRPQGPNQNGPRPNNDARPQGPSQNGPRPENGNNA